MLVPWTGAQCGWAPSPPAIPNAPLTPPHAPTPLHSLQAPYTPSGPWPLLSLLAPNAPLHPLMAPNIPLWPQCPWHLLGAPDAPYTPADPWGPTLPASPSMNPYTPNGPDGPNALDTPTLWGALNAKAPYSPAGPWALHSLPAFQCTQTFSTPPDSPLTLPLCFYTCYKPPNTLMPPIPLLASEPLHSLPAPMHLTPPTPSTNHPNAHRCPNTPSHLLSSSVSIGCLHVNLVIMIHFGSIFQIPLCIICVRQMDQPGCLSYDASNDECIVHEQITKADLLPGIET